MAEDQDQNVEAGLNPGRVAAAAMVVGGGLLGVVATLWTIMQFWQLSQTAGSSAADFATPAVLLVAAWGLALLLWGAAEILRRLDDVSEALREDAAAAPVLRSRPAATGPASDVQEGLTRQLVELAQELRDIAMLSEPERKQRAQVESTELVRRLEQEVPALLREHDWQEARLRVQRARQRFPALPNWDALDQQIEAARATIEAHDVEATTREVNDLAALGAWDRASEAVRHLQQRHPGSQKVTELARRIAVGRDKATAEERTRLMARAQEATNRRDWNEALRWVDAVLEKYPDSGEAADLRLQVPTLRTNAEIQARQQMETGIRDLIKEHHYAEALRRARELIERYPTSPQAAVLREQLPRLEQKAADNW